MTFSGKTIKFLYFEVARLRTLYDKNPDLHDLIIKRYSEVVEELNKREAPWFWSNHKLDEFVKIAKAFMRPNKPAWRIFTPEEVFDVSGFELPVIVDLKIDGMRLQIHNSGEVQIFSEDEALNKTSKFKESLTDIRKLPEGTILDAEGVLVVGEEVLHRTSFIGYVNGKGFDAEKDKQTQFWVFDVLRWGEKDLTEEPLEVRLSYLKKIPKCEHLKPFREGEEYFVCKTKPEVLAAVKKVAGRKGSEGAMIKLLSSKYVKDVHNKGWIKLKNLKEVDCLVVEIEQPKHHKGPLEGKPVEGVYNYHVAAGPYEEKDGRILLEKVPTKVREFEGKIYAYLGKSIKGDRLIPVKQENKIELLTHEELWQRNQGVISIDDEGCQIQECKGLETLVDIDAVGVWKPIKHLVRHLWRGYLRKIESKWGETIITPSHGVYGQDCNLYSPDELDKKQVFPKHLERINLPEDLDITVEIVDLIGAFISEGCLGIYHDKTNRQIRHTAIGNKDHVWLYELEKKAEKIFGNEWCVSGDLLVCNSGRVYSFFEQCVGKNGEKRLPSWVFRLTRRLKKRLLESYMKGDGSIHVYEESWGTTSYELASGLNMLRSSLGEEVTYRFKTPYQFYHARINTGFSVFGKRKSRRIKKIRKPQVSKEWFYGYVYDVEISPETPSFIDPLGMLVLHNTFNTEVKVKVGNIIRIWSPEINKYSVKETDLFTYGIFEPKVLEWVHERNIPDSLNVLDRLARQTSEQHPREVVKQDWCVDQGGNWVTVEGRHLCLGSDRNLEGGIIERKLISTKSSASLRFTESRRSMADKASLLYNNSSSEVRGRIKTVDLTDRNIPLGEFMGGVEKDWGPYERYKDRAELSVGGYWNESEGELVVSKSGDEGSLLHEFGHASFPSDLKDRRGWESIWKGGGLKISGLASVSSSEGFAEAFKMYSQDPHLLEEKNEAAFAFMEEYFSGH